MYPCKVLVMDDMDTHSLKYSAECPVDLLQDLFRAHVQLSLVASFTPGIVDIFIWGLKRENQLGVSLISPK